MREPAEIDKFIRDWRKISGHEPITTRTSSTTDVPPASAHGWTLSPGLA